MLYTNFSEVLVSDKPFPHHPTLGLTSKKIRGYCHTLSTEKEQASFFSTNKFSPKASQSLLNLFHEGRINNILIFLMDNRTPKLQNDIVEEFLKRKANVAHNSL